MGGGREVHSLVSEVLPGKALGLGSLPFGLGQNFAIDRTEQPHLGRGRAACIKHCWDVGRLQVYRAWY